MWNLPKKCRAVIFDFNGTLFDDTEFHNQAWTEFFNDHRIRLTNEDIDERIHGYTNREILERFFNKPLHSSDLNRYYEEKENIYRKICDQNKEQCVLTKGAIEFLDFITSKNIVRTIATASYLINVKLYFTLFRLDRWFDFNKVVYDSGEYRGKPFPDMYIAASGKIGIPVSECMIIEDSKSGIAAARNAGAGIIMAVAFNGKTDKFSEFDYIDGIIDDFRNLEPYFQEEIF